MRRTLLVLFSLFYVTAYAQNGTGTPTFKFKSKIKDAEYNVKYDENSMGRSNLGDDVARKVYVIRKNYTYVEPATPTSPTPRTIIKKPALYNAMNRLVKSYEKDVKKNLIDITEATTQLNKYLDIIYSVFSVNTADLESALKGKSERQEITEVLSRVILE